MVSSIAVDYLSFSVDLVNKIEDLHLGLAVVADALKDLIGIAYFEGIFLEPDGWEPAKGQRPYMYGQANHRIGVFVWYGGHSNALVQFSGNGCKFLERHDMLGDIIESVQNRLTRLDIAIDIETATSPKAFCDAGYNGRIKSYGEQRSPSGETCYVGSRKSQKFCRVYRYSEPHPRSKYLRVEYETKKEQAQIVASTMLEHGLAYASQALTKYYEWRHSDMPEPHEMVEKMQSMVSQRSDAKTMYWLLTQVAPAIQRLVENGTIENPQEFFSKNFMPSEEKIYNENND